MQPNPLSGKQKPHLPFTFRQGGPQSPPQTWPQYLISSPLPLHISTFICEQAEGQPRDHLQGHVTEGCTLDPVQLHSSHDTQLNCFRVTDSSASSCQHMEGGVDLDFCLPGTLSPRPLYTALDCFA